MKFMDTGNLYVAKKAAIYLYPRGYDGFFAFSVVEWI